MDWRTVTLLRSNSFTDETHSRHSLRELLAIECASPPFVLPLAGATAILCALLLNVISGVVVGILCLIADVSLRQRRMGVMLAHKLSDSHERVETSNLLSRLTVAEAEWLQGSTGQQLGQIRVNPALMSVKILRERICAHAQLMLLLSCPGFLLTPPSPLCFVKVAVVSSSRCPTLHLIGTSSSYRHPAAILGWHPSMPSGSMRYVIQSSCLQAVPVRTCSVLSVPNVALHASVTVVPFRSLRVISSSSCVSA